MVNSLGMLSVVLLLSFVELGSCKFLWGTATAAYQVEGHRNDSSRQPSIWDCFDTDMRSANGVSCDSIRAVKPSGQPNIYNNQNAAVADNDYVTASPAQLVCPHAVPPLSLSALCSLLSALCFLLSALCFLLSALALLTTLCSLAPFCSLLSPCSSC